MAGFNNIKLQLESMVAIAAITGRTLVLPPPGPAAHIHKQYYEFDIFDAAALIATVPVALSMERDDSTAEVRVALADVDFRQLDQDRHWFFPMWPSRIQNFECLHLSDRDRAIAAHAVLHGVAFDHHLEEMASAGLQLLGLASGDSEEDERGARGFDCVHVRRGDFETFAPQYALTDADLSARLKGMLLSGRPVLLVSDQPPRLDLGVNVTFSGGAYVGNASLETRIAVDMIMCSRAVEFVGSPLSTFTNGILELQRRRALLAGHGEVLARFYAGEPEFAVSSGTCSNKQTTFDAVKLCDRGAAVCFADCAGPL